MFAIVEIAGEQIKVEKGQKVLVNRLEGKEGDSLDIEALLVSGDGKTSTNAATLKATVVSHGRADKIIVFKKKRRKQYKRKQGHRQGYTEIKIEKI